LQAANSLSSPQLLRAGAWLLVPNSSDRSGSRSTASAAGANFTGRHQIKEGETLGLIAQRYRTSAAELQIANNLASANSIMPGTWLKVPVAAMPAARPAAVPATKAASSNARTDSTRRRHQVQAGETLSSIAARYGVTPDDLQKANGIRSPLSLQIGTWLQIPAKGGSPPERPAIARK
jgi:LysM repeat protein